MSNQFQTFKDISAYNDGELDTGRSRLAFRAAWSVINDRTYGGETERRAAIHKWINQVVGQLLEWRENITRVQRLNSQLYQGRHYANQDLWSMIPFARGRAVNKNHSKTVLNFIGQSVDLHVAAMCGYEPNLTVVPSNDEESDRVSARMNRMCLDYYFYKFKLKTAFQTFHRRKKIHGETFCFVLWDDELGDLHPKYKELKRMRQEQGEDPDAPIPLLDQNGVQITGDDNSPLFITNQVKTGDVKLEFEYSERVLYPTPESCLWEDVPYIIRMKWIAVDEVKARWPAYADQIKADGMYRRYMGPRRALESKVCVRYMYHKPTSFLENGYYSISTESVLLEHGEWPDELPVIRGTDIDLDFEITGMSFIQHLASLQYAINESTSMILQNQALFAYPKYQAPRGAKINFRNLDDDRGIYEYSGPKGAEVVVQNSTANDTWQTRNMLKDEFNTLSMVFPVSKGQTPPGITANVALRMLEEEERKAYKPAIDKHGENVERLGTLVLTTLANYRDPTDGMMIKILGKNNEQYLKEFDVSNLTKNWECKLIKSSGLPESPAARTQTVLDLKERFPNLIADDEALEYMDIARPEKLVDLATQSRQSAEGEVEDILSGVPNVTPPQPYHDLIPRYRVYMKAVQSRAFDQAEPMIKQRMLNHIVTAEYLMSLKFKNNPIFMQTVLTTYPSFPTYFTELPPPMNPMQLAQPPQLGAPGTINSAPLGGMPPEAASPEQQLQPPPGQIPDSPPLPQQDVPAEGSLP